MISDTASKIDNFIFCFRLLLKMYLGFEVLQLDTEKIKTFVDLVFQVHASVPNPLIEYLSTI